MRTKDREFFDKVVHTIQRNIDGSKGQKNDLGIDEKNLTLKSWRYDRISEEEFLQTADIGDVILFRGKHFGAKLTRSWSKSHFDHVAMVLKFEAEKDTIFLLESTTNKGVAIVRWNNLRLWKDDYYEHVVYRQLEVERTEELLDNMEAFIKKVLGNKYKINFKNVLLARQSTMPGQGPADIENRKFFCSELVAKCYKELGILDT